MNGPTPERLILIAGKGTYPRQLAESARHQGVRHLALIAFKGETERSLTRLADETHWIRLGQLAHMLEVLKDLQIPAAVMAGRITPTSLFRVRPDAAMAALLRRLKQRNADTIFGAVADELGRLGIALLPAYRFMETHMPAPGLLADRPPTAREQADIELGLRVAKLTSGLEVGQSVVIKEGTILAVEAFEGTDATILRAGRLGGPGAVVVKVAKRGHDMRFDIPVIGRQTFKTLRKAGVSALAVEAGRTILLERDLLIREANRQNVCLIAVPTEDYEQEQARHTPCGGQPQVNS